MKIKENVVCSYLLSKNIKPHLLGFTYLKDAIMLVFENRQYQNHITTKLYPDIAKIENTTPIRVERAIRHAFTNAKIKLSSAKFISLAVIELTITNK